MASHKNRLFSNGIANPQHSFKYSQLFHNTGWQNQAIRTSTPTTSQKPVEKTKQPEEEVEMTDTKTWSNHPLEDRTTARLETKLPWQTTPRNVGDGTFAKYLNRTNFQKINEPLTSENIEMHQLRKDSTASSASSTGYNSPSEADSRMTMRGSEQERIKRDFPVANNDNPTARAAPAIAAAAGGGKGAAAAGKGSGRFMSDAQNATNVKSIFSGIFKGWANREDIKLQAKEHEQFFNTSTGQSGHFHGMHTTANLETLAMARAHDRVKNYRNTGEAIGGPIGGIIGWMAGKAQRDKWYEEELKNTNFKTANDQSGRALDPRFAASSTYTHFKPSTMGNLDAERNWRPNANEMKLRGSGITFHPNEYNGFLKVPNTNIPPPSVKSEVASPRPSTSPSIQTIEADIHSEPSSSHTPSIKSLELPKETSSTETQTDSPPSGTSVSTQSETPKTSDSSTSTTTPVSTSSVSTNTEQPPATTTSTSSSAGSQATGVGKGGGISVGVDTHNTPSVSTSTTSSASTTTHVPIQSSNQEWPSYHSYA
jgi:hypothetical protein